MMLRRQLVLGLAALAVGARPTAAAGQLGIVLMHGKTAPPNSRPLAPLVQALGSTDASLATPEMPWSRSRYLSGNAAQALDEIAGAIGALKAAGASSILLVGHSMGAAAALAYAAQRGGVMGLSLVAMGHVPRFYYRGLSPATMPVRDAIVRAREMAASGRGDEVATFADSNQGTALAPRLSAREFLSWFDPEAGFDAVENIARAPCPVQWVVGRIDPIFAQSRELFFDRLPPDSRHELVVVDGGHLDTPANGAAAIVAFARKLGGL